PSEILALSRCRFPGALPRRYCKATIPPSRGQLPDERRASSQCCAGSLEGCRLCQNELVERSDFTGAYAGCVTPCAPGAPSVVTTWRCCSCKTKVGASTPHTNKRARLHDNEDLVQALVICRVHRDCLAGPVGSDVPKRFNFAIADDRRVSAGSPDARGGCARAGADDTDRKRTRL